MPMTFDEHAIRTEIAKVRKKLDTLDKVVQGPDIPMKLFLLDTTMSAVTQQVSNLTCTIFNTHEE